MSSSDIAISIHNLAKSYTIHHDGLRRPTFRELLVDKVKHPFRERNQEKFWALQDVSFDVKKGDVVGIIGRNGAGKSTLLKLLSRIVEPTTGGVDIFGRVGSLLEVGTGFHQELTGRENIFLNGAILGMRRHEIKRRFDAIVDFAEVDKFLDTPVKRYSSGMYVRLAFAVAAHLEPEILIVDEVLAVGDAAFQKKCLGKMGEVAHGGRTVLFVSHNMAAVRRLCNRGVLLHQGRLLLDSDTETVLARYSNDHSSNSRVAAGEGISVEFELQNASGMKLKSWEAHSDAIVNIRLRSERPMPHPAVDLAFYTENGQRVFAVQTDRTIDPSSLRGSREISFVLSITNPGFACEQLSMDLGIRTTRGLQYAACWESVDIVRIGLDDSLRTSASEVLLVPKCQVRAEMSR